MSEQENFEQRPSIAEAERFISLLTGHANSKMTFQIFAEGGRILTPRILHGSIQEHFMVLADANMAGYGVFVMINEGDFLGRKAINVKGLRANFVDDDGDAGEPVKFEEDCCGPFEPLHPSITVQSKNGQHNYFKLTKGQPMLRFSDVQRQLALHFNTDKAVNDLCRVMRLPGFFHNKDPEKPFFVKVVANNEKEYTIEEIAEAYPAKRDGAADFAVAKGAAHDAVTSGGRRNRDQFAIARRYLESMPPAVEGESGDSTTYNVCCYLVNDLSLEPDQALSLLGDWNAKCKPPWSHQELVQKLENAKRYAKGERGSRLKRSSNDGAYESKDSPLTSTLQLFKELNPLQGDDEKLYVRLPMANGGLDNRPIDSPAALNWIRAEVYRRSKGSVSDQMLKTATSILTAQHAADEPVPVRLRTASGGDGSIFIDLGDKTREMIRVDAEGWAIVKGASGFLFQRPPSMKPLVRPVRGGNVENLKPFVNVPDDESFRLLVAFLVSTFRPETPFVFMLLNSTEGGAKTTTARFCKNLVDGIGSEVRTMPKDEEGLWVSAASNHLLTMDNLTNSPAWLSDAICCLCTGAERGARKMYSDGDEHVMRAKRPIIMTGIEVGGLRQDAMSRALVFDLPRIKDGDRRTEAELEQLFKDAAPGIFGALLDLLVLVLKRLPVVRAKKLALPRMADFAQLAMACSPGLCMSDEEMLEAYSRNIANVFEETVDSDVFSQAVVNLANRGGVEGKWREVLNKIEDAAEFSFDGFGKKKIPQWWPASGRGLSSYLRRCASGLEHHGVIVELPKPNANSQYRTYKVRKR